MEIDCEPEDSLISSFDEDCVRLGGVKDMRLEAEAVVSDVLFAVTEMYVSQSLDCAHDVAYINVEIREGTRFCLELTEAGLRVRHFRHGIYLHILYTHTVYIYIYISVYIHIYIYSFSRRFHPKRHPRESFTKVHKSLIHTLIGH